jgi:hypothetical protein
LPIGTLLLGLVRNLPWHVHTTRRATHCSVAGAEQHKREQASFLCDAETEEHKLERPASVRLRLPDRVASGFRNEPCKPNRTGGNRHPSRGNRHPSPPRLAVVLATQSPPAVAAVCRARRTHEFGCDFS